MSESNRVAISYRKEVTLGTVDPGPFQDFDFVSESFAQNPTSQPSTTIRSDLQVPDNVRLNIAPKGDIAFNLSYGPMDNFLAGLMNTTWPGSPFTVTGSIGVVGATKKYTSDTTGTGPSFVGVQVGQWVLMSGFTNPTNNGYKKVVAVSTAVPAAEFITVADTTVVDEAAAPARSAAGTAILNGTTLSGWSIEKRNTDLSNVFDWALGNRVSKLELKIPTSKEITGMFSFENMTDALTGAATISNGTHTAPSGTPELNGNDHVGQITLNSVAATFSASDITMAIQSALRHKPKLGLLGSFDIGVGRFTVTGTLSIYFQDRTLLDSARAFNNVQLAILIKNTSDAHAYMIDMLNGRIWDGDPITPGIDKDVMANFKFSAQIDSVSGKMLSVTRF